MVRVVRESYPYAPCAGALKQRRRKAHVGNFNQEGASLYATRANAFFKSGYQAEGVLQGVLKLAGGV